MKKLQLTKYAYEVSDEVYDFVQDYNNGDYGDQDLSEAIFDYISNQFIYYNQAFDYIKSMRIANFEEAIETGYKDICGIASYYLEQEMFKSIKEIEEEEEEEE